MNLLTGGGAQNLDDFHQLVDTGLAGKQRLAQQQLCHHAAARPDVDGGSVVSGAENELRSAVVARANIADIDLALDDALGTAEVAELEQVVAGVNQ